MIVIVGRKLRAFFRRSPVLEPELSGDLVDTMGGALIIRGADLEGVLGAEVSADGAAWLPAAVSSVTSTSVTITTSALPAGAYLLRVVTRAGPSNAITIEAWNPSAEPGCTIFCERPDYSGATGIWTARKGPNIGGGLYRPQEADGEPQFTQDPRTELDNTIFGGVIGLHTGTLATIVQPQVSLNRSTNPGFLGIARGQITDLYNAQDAGRRVFGVRGFDRGAGRFYDVQVEAPSALDRLHAVVASYRSQQSVSLSVNGMAPASAPLQGPNGVEEGNHVLRLGRASTLTSNNYWAGRIRAFALYTEQHGGAFVAKFNKWAHARHL